MPSYYISITIIPTQSTLIVGYYTSKPLLILNPTAMDLELVLVPTKVVELIAKVIAKPIKLAKIPLRCDRCKH
jgi:hypothetical protein